MLVGTYQPFDPSDRSKVNPTLKTALEALRNAEDTNYDAALAASVKYFDEAAPNRNKILVFLSDGEPITFSNNLSGLEDVTRIAVGVGKSSKLVYLDKIDNTPDAEGKMATQALSSDDLKGILTESPVAGKVIEFKITVNGVLQNFNVADIAESGATGLSFGEFYVSGLDPSGDDVVTATVVIDRDGLEGTTNDQATLTTTNTISG